jgi:hypothetical protein
MREIEDVPDHLRTDLSPLGWEHVNLTGDYVWSQTQLRKPSPIAITPVTRARPPSRRLFPIVRCAYQRSNSLVPVDSYSFFTRSGRFYTLCRCAWRDHVLKTFGAALLLASGLVITAGPALALEVVVTQVDKNTDGSMTYHFAVKTDQGETLMPGASKATADFVTVYNFYGLVDGSAKSPAGWEFSSEEFGRTPTLNGYPMVLPVDIPGTPNLTWTVTKPVAAGAQIDGFTATTRVSAMTQGEYTAQVTRQAPAVQGAAAGTPGAAAMATKQALIGTLPTPSFLANVK